MSGQQDDFKLPPLRGELQVVSQPPRSGMLDGCVILDPVRQRYFDIDHETRCLISLWEQVGTAGALVDLAQRRFGLSIAIGQVRQLAEFIEANGLTVERAKGWQALAAEAARGKPGIWHWLIHNYLFIRIPLVRPDAFLRGTIGFLAPLFSRWFALFVGLCGAAGLYLASRQWDAFLATFMNLFTLEGALLYGAALIIVKSLHELGHAYVAVRYGCRVPTMGVCFMMLFPMLYTDVSDAWRIRSRRQRVLIGAAGLIVELAIACLATLFWAFLPDGPMRSLAFALATTGWIMSLALNLNPFMRFDGYYILSDLVGIPNLQPRAFAIGVWRLRETLFGLGVQPPERFASRTMTALTCYAWAVWLYRLVLFTGIAVLVYHMTFKVLGIVLFAVEIVYLLGWPIQKEIRSWIAMRSSLRLNWHTATWSALVVAMMVAIFVPWSGRVSIPAVIEGEEVHVVYPPRAGRLETAALSIGARVEPGAVLARLSSPDLEHEIVTAEARLAAVTLRLRRRAADAEDRAASLVLGDSEGALREKLRGLIAEREELVVRADYQGSIVEVGATAHAGRWIARSEPLATIVGGAGLRAHGFVHEDDLERLEPGAAGRFIPEDPMWPAVDVVIARIGFAASASIDTLDLTSRYGGAIAVRAPAQAAGARVLIPVAARYPVTARITSDTVPIPGRAIRGVILAAGRNDSLAHRAWRQIMRVLIRESGF